MKSIKLTNPLNYPLAILAGGIVLFLSVRLVQLPSFLMLPVSGAIATMGASFLKSKQPEKPDFGNPILEKELESVKQQAQLLAEKAENLRTESEKLLTPSDQIELLSLVQYACNNAQELPGKIEELSRRLHGENALLSVPELQKQLAEIEVKKGNSSGIAQEKLKELAASINNNIKLAQQGEDARQAQVISLSSLIIESAGVLQQLQNKLRTSNLDNSESISELRSLSTELNSLQENVDFLFN